MPEMTTVVDTSVSATPARVGFPLNHAGITATNSGTTAVYYRYDPDALTSTLAGATDAAMKARGGSRIDAGESVFFPGTVPYIDVACVTGVTGTLKYDAGQSRGGDDIALMRKSLAAQGIMPVRVGFGVATIAAGANAITLHASTACKYFYFFVPTGGSVVYYRPGGAAADSATTPNQPIDATMQGKLVILDTPATSITLWGVLASSVVWVAGNDA